MQRDTGKVGLQIELVPLLRCIDLGHPARNRNLGLQALGVAAPAQASWPEQSKISLANVPLGMIERQGNASAFLKPTVAVYAPCKGCRPFGLDADRKVGERPSPDNP